MKNMILVGADPELFMRHPDSNDFISAHGRVPGTKSEPFKVPFGAIQVDGTALEFNIDPAKTVEEFVHNIKAVKTTLENYVPGYNVVAEPVAIYDEDYFKWDVPASAQELGCDPDFNGWTGLVNPRPDPNGKPMRTASGHIHIGWGEGFDPHSPAHFEQCCRVARQMDYYLGIQSLLWDKDGTRRELYGKAGAFRPKPYGMEYRVLSNRWLANDALTAWVYKAVQLGMEHAALGRWAENVYGDSAMKIIDQNQVDWKDKFLISLDLEKVPA
jgi:hypothetical protein